MKITESQTARPDVRQIPRAEASQEIIEAARLLEDQFAINFYEFYQLSEAFLHDIHNADTTLRDSVTIASNSKPEIIAKLAQLSPIVNPPGRIPTMAEREFYRQTLLNVYKELSLCPSQETGAVDTLFVGVEREGRILAQALDCLPKSHSLRPNAKRLHVKSDLVVGVTEMEAVQQGAYEKCVIIDGAIATGATLITMMEKFAPALKAQNSGFQIYSAHATFEGLRALVRYASFQKAFPVKITVGHATAGLNESYYAIEIDGKSLVVGDLGDTMSPLDNHQSMTSLTDQSAA